MDSIQLEEWIEQTDALRAKLYAFGKSPLPLESGERHQAWMLYPGRRRRRRLLADLDSYLTQHMARRSWT